MWLGKVLSTRIGQYLPQLFMYFWEKLYNHGRHHGKLPKSSYTTLDNGRP